ncbi:NADH-quinone oxidoreductase subunit NuoN [Rhodobacter sphaeroides]|jgi:NADH-quinone oxidoreductase subunit N|uniref:NADH-quinone oxidoreductase subunit N n=2 Tax=Cereibacter sphaeroides TaxID=1063 RepID=Q3J3E4_CERS4|nr:NADH-quinone oxidoreductase subunit NuoN [Cereibacter sphaeroides]ABN76301.1 proton-translocating NADH-quinone oxidoreductase, chain N [Cereibacter sphaeroides ATCC 17029]EKX57215.1 NADH-ubiquinone oxidoreductase chain N [Rhodobacter sp. AKP1]ABA78690.1 NADH dehydrogenase subunit N [Cereibacter sphaeroides 2.4.1]ACM00704.1 Proton-translocating NADH-quinone oxidoreductase, chain N [Cereibacter sphaeroides KD131]AMJ47029.1 NADH-quinone oxidoreductase subunit N [Cereibacter sphaeroides]
MTSADFSTVLPEMVLAISAMLGLMAGVYGGKDRLTPVMTWVFAGLMLFLALWIGFGGSGARTAFGGMFIEDPFSRFAKVTILASAAAVLLLGQEYMQRRDLGRFEFPILVALSVTGMMMMVSAGDLIALYMGLELQSLALYVVASLRRDSVKSTEAGMKYFVLGALSSGLLLYGASLVYGFAGTTLFSGILATVNEGVPLGLLFGLVFMLSGLAFKVSAAPFHMWTPDVYEGSPTPVTAFFSTAPKVAAIALIARTVHDAFGGIPMDWRQVLAALAVASMFLGSVAAIGQRDIKRLMAYSSIGHMGYALVGLAAGTAAGVQAMLLYMAIYVTMNVGTFAFILSMEKDGRPVTSIDSLNMFAKREPLKALAVLVLMFSLAGVPPFIGFFAKFYILKAAVSAGMAWLAVLTVLAAVIGAYYYMRIVYYMYFGKDGDPVESRMGGVQWTMLMAAAAINVLGVINMFGLEPLAAVAAETLVR